MVVDWRPRPNRAGDRICLGLIWPSLSFVLEMFCALCSIIGQRRANISRSDHQRARMDLLPAHGAVAIVHALLLYELSRDLVRPSLGRLMFGLFRRLCPQANILVVLPS